MSEVYIPIATTLASCLIIWLLVLSVMVIKSRGSAKVSLGDGDDVTLQRRIRAQANLIEYAPLFVILIAILELQNGNIVILSVLAIMFLLGRLAHGYALAFTPKNAALRSGGMGLTFLALALAALYGLVMVAV